MTTLEKSKVAVNFYESNRSKNLYSGFEKLVATDGVNSMFVNSDYDPENDKIAVFKLETRNQNTSVQLYKPKNAK